MWELLAAICTSHYKTKTTIPGSCTLTAVETAEHVYTECAAKHWAKQSVCTSLDENDVTHSVLLGSKNVRKGGALIFKF
jgi:hypothetical protein